VVLQLVGHLARILLERRNESFYPLIYGGIKNKEGFLITSRRNKLTFLSLILVLVVMFIWAGLALIPPEGKMGIEESELTRMFQMREKAYVEGTTRIQLAPGGKILLSRYGNKAAVVWNKYTETPHSITGLEEKIGSVNNR
jgi:hypothetical protein